MTWINVERDYSNMESWFVYRGRSEGMEDREFERKREEGRDKKRERKREEARER